MRIVDLSVAPNVVRANTNATAIMIAERTQDSSKNGLSFRHFPCLMKSATRSQIIRTVLCNMGCIAANPGSLRS